MCIYIYEHPCDIISKYSQTLFIQSTSCLAIPENNEFILFFDQGHLMNNININLCTPYTHNLN